MNTTELERYMMSHPIIKPYFGGVLSKDTIPTKIINNPRIYIVDNYAECQSAGRSLDWDLDRYNS